MKFHCITWLLVNWTSWLTHAKFFFILSSLSDRKPVESEDEIVVMVVPDYQMLAYVEKIASNLSDDPVLIWSPRSFFRSDGLLTLISVIHMILMIRNVDFHHDDESISF